MKILKILGKLSVDTSIFFTVITALYSVLMMIINVSEDEPAMRASWLLYIFLFSFLAALSQLIYRLEIMHKAWRVTIQYIMLLFSSYVCFFLPLSMTGNQIVIGLTLVTIIYFACFGVGAFFTHRFRKKIQKEEIYEKKFKSQK